MKDRTIDARIIVKDLKNGLLAMAIAAVISGVMFAGLSGVVVKNIYKSTAEFAIIDDQSSESSIAVTDKSAVMKTLQETCLSLLESESFIGEALASAGYSDISPGSFIDNNLKAEKMQGVVFRIEVNTEKAEESYAIAEAISKKLVEYVPSISNEYSLSVLDKPMKQGAKDNTKKAAILGVIIGLLLSVAYIVLRGLITMKIRNKSDIGLVTDIPVIAEIKGAELAVSDNDSEKEFRTIKNELLWEMNKRGRKAVMFSAADDSACCEKMCLRTAEAIAAANKKIILVDAGLTCGGITKDFEKTAISGFSDLLVKKNNIEDCIIQINSNGVSFDFMPTGCLDPRDALGYVDAGIIRWIIDSLTDKYDCVVVNAESINSSPETVMMSRLLDTVVVVDSKPTRLDTLQNAVNKLKNSADKIIGIVFCR